MPPMTAGASIRCDRFRRLSGEGHTKKSSFAGMNVQVRLARDILLCATRDELTIFSCNVHGMLAENGTGDGGGRGCYDIIIRALRHSLSGVER